MGTKVGALIKEARTNAKLSQTKLADLIGVSASDISKAEKGEKDFSQALLKKIAVATDITQKSLLEAAKEEAAEGEESETKLSGILSDALGDVLGVKKTAKKTSSTKTSTAKKTTATKKTSSAKKTTTAKKTSSSSKVELTAAEKKLVELYRAADSDTKKNAVAVLKGESTGTLANTLLNVAGNFLKS